MLCHQGSWLVLNLIKEFMSIFLVRNLDFALESIMDLGAVVRKSTILFD